MSKTTLPTDSKERKDYPLFRGLLRYFPAALAGVARISKIGNDKHNPGEEMHHARGKSMDHADCIIRHLMDLGEDFGQGVGRDENGVPQVFYVAWRALALAQEWAEANLGAPLAPGAKLPAQIEKVVPGLSLTKYAAEKGFSAENNLGIEAIERRSGQRRKHNEGSHFARWNNTRRKGDSQDVWRSLPRRVRRKTDRRSAPRIPVAGRRSTDR